MEEAPRANLDGDKVGIRYCRALCEQIPVPVPLPPLAVSLMVVSKWMVSLTSWMQDWLQMTMSGRLCGSKEL